MQEIHNLPTLLRLFLFACLTATLIIIIIFITLLCLSRRKVKSQIIDMIASFIAILLMTFIRTPLYDDFSPLVLEILNYSVLLPIITGIIYFIIKKDYSTLFDVIVFIFNLPQFHNLAFFKYIHIASVGYFLIRSVDIALSIYIDNKYDRGVYMIKDALHVLSYGVLFANKKGQIIFINKQMYNFMALVGINPRVKVNRIVKALKDKEDTSKKLSNDTIVISLKKMTLSFTIKREKKIITQIICSNITQEVNVLKELEYTSNELNLIQNDLKSAIEDINKVEKEKEILLLKGNLHDSMSQRLSILHCYIIENKGEDIKQIKNLISSMLFEMYDASLLSIEDRLEQLIKSFAIIGVDLKVDGNLPKENGKANFALKVIRECTTNALRHGQASEVDVTINEIENNRYALTISNNGLASEDYVEGNGIKSIKYQLSQIGGSIKITSYPEFKIDFII